MNSQITMHKFSIKNDLTLTIPDEKNIHTLDRNMKEKYLHLLDDDIENTSTIFNTCIRDDLLKFIRT